jgi:hypothetical protein
MAVSRLKPLGRPPALKPDAVKRRNAHNQRFDYAPTGRYASGRRQTAAHEHRIHAGRGMNRTRERDPRVDPVSRRQHTHIGEY